MVTVGLRFNRLMVCHKFLREKVVNGVDGNSSFCNPSPSV